MDQRIHFVSWVNESDETFTALCERFGISRKTGYKWVARHEARGAAGLAEHRPVAHASEQNGRHERMHRTLKDEVASPPAASMLAQQRARPWRPAARPRRPFCAVPPTLLRGPGALLRGPGGPSARSRRPCCAALAPCCAAPAALLRIHLGVLSYDRVAPARPQRPSRVPTLVSGHTFLWLLRSPGPS
ncbi:helix-turn-helix domain-containing protein [Sorangium sp. So ce281]